MTKANFTPETNGFAFINSWTFDQTESDLIRNTLTAATNDALILLNPIFGPGLRFVRVGPVLADWIFRAVPQVYGLCGGMAFAALDYYRANLALPRGSGRNNQPTRATRLVISCELISGRGYWIA